MAKRKEHAQSITGPSQNAGKVKGAANASRSRDRLELLRAFSRSLSQATDEAGLLDVFCSYLAQLGGYRAVWIGYPRDDAGKTVQVAARAGEDVRHIDSAQISWGDTATGKGPTGTAIRSRQVVVSHDIRSDPFFNGWRNQAQEAGYSSSVAVPITHKGDLLGVLNIYSVEPDAFDPAEVALLSEISGNLAAAIHNLRQQAQSETLQRSHALQVALNSLLNLALRTYPVKS